MGSAPSGARRPTPLSAQLSKPAAATAGALSTPSAMLWQSPRPSRPQCDPVDRGEQLLVHRVGECGRVTDHAVFGKLLSVLVVYFSGSHIHMLCGKFCPSTRFFFR